MLSTLYFLLFIFLLSFLSFSFFLSFILVYFLSFFFLGGWEGMGGEEGGKRGFFCIILQNFQKVPNVWYLIILKRADLRWNRRLEDMEQLTKLQDELLDAASM